jgi:hypothetical protein
MGLPAGTKSESWCDEAIEVVVHGPDGPRHHRINKCYALVGSHKACDVALPREWGVPATALYLHATAEGVYCTSLVGREFDGKRYRGWMSASNRVTLGKASIAAWLADRPEPSPPFPPDLMRAEELAGAPAVELLLGQRATRRVRMGRRLFLVGRRSPSKLHVNHASVSRVHCALYWDGVSLWAIDLLSANGTTVDQQPVETARLAVGGILGLGKVKLRYVVGTEGQPANWGAGDVTGEETGLATPSEEPPDARADRNAMSPLRNRPLRTSGELTVDERYSERRPRPLPQLPELPNPLSSPPLVLLPEPVGPAASSSPSASPSEGSLFLADVPEPANVNGNAARSIDFVFSQLAPGEIIGEEDRGPLADAGLPGLEASAKQILALEALVKELREALSERSRELEEAQTIALSQRKALKRQLSAELSSLRRQLEVKDLEARARERDLAQWMSQASDRSLLAERLEAAQVKFAAAEHASIALLAQLETRNERLEAELAEARQAADDVRAKLSSAEERQGNQASAEESPERWEEERVRLSQQLDDLGRERQRQAAESAADLDRLQREWQLHQQAMDREQSDLRAEMARISAEAAEIESRLRAESSQAAREWGEERERHAKQLEQVRQELTEQAAASSARIKELEAVPAAAAAPSAPDVSEPSRPAPNPRTSPIAETLPAIPTQERSPTGSAVIPLDAIANRPDEVTGTARPAAPVRRSGTLRRKMPGESRPPARRPPSGRKPPARDAGLPPGIRSSAARGAPKESTRTGRSSIEPLALAEEQVVLDRFFDRQSELERKRHIRRIVWGCLLAVLAGVLLGAGVYATSKLIDFLPVQFNPALPDDMTLPDGP